MTQTCANASSPTPDFRLELPRDWLATLPAHSACIVMDAPPPEKCREFAAIATLLQQTNLNAPRVLAHDFERSSMLLTDLGTTPYIKALNTSNAAGPSKFANTLTPRTRTGDATIG